MWILHRERGYLMGLRGGERKRSKRKVFSGVYYFLILAI